MTKLKRFKFAIEYAFALACAGMLYLFIDGDAGFLFIAVLVLIPIFSFIMTFIAKKQYNVSLNVSDTVLNKGDELVVTITVRRTSSATPPFICLDLVTDGKLGGFNEAVVIPMTYGQETVSEIRLKAEYCGGTEIRAENICVCGLFGMLKLKTRSVPCSKTLAVHPDRLQLPASNMLLAAANAASSFDDSEETTETITAVSGVPGYEHREYEPGDSLKRVNWKLSAKRDSLYVRLDEALAKSKISLVLSPSDTGSDEENDILLEGLFAFAERLSELDNRCVLHYIDERAWLGTPVETHEEVEELRSILSHLRFDGASGAVVPFDEIASRKATAMVVIFCAVYGENEDGAAEQCEKNGYDTAIVTVRANVPTQRRLWLLSREDGVLSLG